MQVVDPSKVDCIRDLIDEEIAAYAIEHETTRGHAYFAYCADVFQTSLALRMHHNGWWCSFAIENFGYYAFHGPEERVASGYMTPPDAARWKLSCALVSRDPETLTLASLLRIIDHSVDLGMDLPTFRVLYGEDEIEKVVDAVCCNCAKKYDLSQQSLFPMSFDDRLEEASILIARELRSEVQSWARYFVGDSLQSAIQ